MDELHRVLSLADEVLRHKILRSPEQVYGKLAGSRPAPVPEVAAPAPEPEAVAEPEPVADEAPPAPADEAVPAEGVGVEGPGA
jgi:hypothetical protein